MRKQTIIAAYPPNFLKVLARFPMASDPGVIFSYGDKIYYRGTRPLPGQLLVHEGTHGERQGDSRQEIEGWWDRYLTEPLFMLDEEIYAHHAEYIAARKRHGPGPKAMRPIAEKLSGPLYNHCLTYAQAQHAILTGEVG